MELILFKYQALIKSNALIVFLINKNIESIQKSNKLMKLSKNFQMLNLMREKFKE